MGCTAAKLKPNAQPYKSSFTKGKFSSKFASSKSDGGKNGIDLKNSANKESKVEEILCKLIDLNSLDGDQIIFKSEFIFKLQKIVAKLTPEQLMKMSSLSNLQSTSQLIDLNVFHSFISQLAKESDLKELTPQQENELFQEMCKENSSITIQGLLSFYQFICKVLVEIMYEEMKRKYLIYGSILPINILDMNSNSLNSLIDTIDQKRTSKSSFFGEINENTTLESKAEVIELISNLVPEVFNVSIISGVESLYDFHIINKITVDPSQKITKHLIYAYLRSVAEELYNDATKIRDRDKNKKDSEAQKQR